MNSEQLMREALADRINAYLNNGGLFNPELADHDAIRDLLFECRAVIGTQSPLLDAGKTIARLDLSLTETIRERNISNMWADKLAKAIAERFGVDIGEHSNVNNPWRNALEALATQPPAPAEKPICYYVSGPYPNDGAMAVCELATGRIVHKFWLGNTGPAPAADDVRRLLAEAVEYLSDTDPDSEFIKLCRTTLSTTKD